MIDESDAKEVATTTPARSPGRRLSGTALAPWAVPLVLSLLIVVFSIALPGSFLTIANWRAMIESQAILVVLALAVTLPLRAGDFDLSIGAVAAFSACVTAVASVQWHWNPGLSLLAGVVAGLLVGIVNCVAVLLIGIDAFIATLATMTVLTGLTLQLTNTTVIIGVPQSIIGLARHNILGIPAGAYYGWGLAIVLWYVYERTPFGRYMLFVKGSHQMARLAGINVTLVRAASFLTCSVISAVAGLILLGTIGAADPGVGSQYLLQPYAAAFLGATTIAIGRFNVLGTLVGLYLIVVGVTGLQLLGASTAISQVFYGGVLLLAVGSARWISRRSPSRPGQG
jgi:ribose transport system permease protein